MSAINRSVRTATRSLRLPAIRPTALRAPSIAHKAKANFGPALRPATAKFSTMAALQSGAPPPAQAREYDPEIKDIASYIHHTPITSDLAVCFAVAEYSRCMLSLSSSTQHDSYF